MLESFLIYNAFLLFVIIVGFLFYLIRKEGIKHSIIIYRILLLVLILFTGLRFDVGTDYSFHLSDFVDRSYSKYGPSYILLTKAFENIDNGFYWIILITCIITYTFLFRAVSSNKSEHIAVPIFIILFLFQFNNILRQAISSSIFLYSIKFITEKNPVKYILYILLAGSFHYSALFLLPLYYVNKVSINKYVFIVAAAFAFIIPRSESSLNVILTQIFHLPYYSHYVFTEFALQGEKNTGLGLIVKTLLGLILILNRPGESESKEVNVYYNLFIIGFLLIPFANKIAVFDRIIYYFDITLLNIIPIFLSSKNFSLWSYISKAIVIILCLALFEAGIYFNTGKNTPYRTIFSTHQKS